MDGPSMDEVIADSEGEEMDEEEPSGNPGLHANVKDIANIVSQVSAFTLPGQLQDNTTSSISAITAGPSAFWRQTSDTSGQINQFSDPDNFPSTASIADRAKTRPRNPKSSIQSLSTKPNATASSDGRLEKQKSNRNASSDVIELTSGEEDDELSLRPSNSKPRPRPKPKLKIKDKPGDRSNHKTLNVSSIAEANTDNSPHVMPVSRPRPRPRPLGKRSKAAQGTAPPPLLPLDIPGLLPSSSASASHGPELPIATSPIRSHLHTSPLPPSDPPLPTLTTIHDENDLPSIETLPNLDFDGPLSSPSSLFSDPGGVTKKRKRPILDLDIDELASDNPDSGKRDIAARSKYGRAEQVPPHILPPPPTFFAGSSSSSIGGDKIPHVPSELARDVVDLTMLPPTIQPTCAVTAKKPTKAKASRRKTVDAMDEHELDANFDPTESTKKGKSKQKSKPRAKKAKKGEEGARVEVSIMSKPRAPKTKGKGKEKATTAGKDAFKSREFIDSGDEEDPMQLIPSSKGPAASDPTHSKSTNGKAAHISTPTAPKVAETLTGASSNSKARLEGNTVVSPGGPGEPMSSSLGNRINKKRKSVIESDFEDDGDEGEKNHQAETGSKKHKGELSGGNSNADEETRGAIQVNPPAATKKGKKGKNEPWSDEDSAIEVGSDPSVGLSKGKKPASKIEDDAYQETTKKQKPKGQKSKTKSKKPVGDASKDDNDGSMVDIQDQELAPETEVAKENVVPMKSTAKVSKTDERPNVESPGLFPSLHSRYEIAPRRGSLPMSELIRRANSIPGTPFATPQSRISSSSTARPKSGTTVTTTYSPYLKSSRSLLSRIAPLHPNRRTPPPPPPRLPPRKKTKRELEMEEKWEEEMIDSVGGISEWTSLADDEKKKLRKAKWAREMGDWDD